MWVHAQVALDIPHNQTLYDLHLKVNPKEVIVGWCAHPSFPASLHVFHLPMQTVQLPNKYTGILTFACPPRYSTGPSVSGSDALIQDYYGHQCSNPVHLTLDTGLNNQQMAVKAYVARTLTLGSRSEPLATQFQEVSCQVQTNAVERIGGSLLACPSVSIHLSPKLLHTVPF